MLRRRGVWLGVGILMAKGKKAAVNSGLLFRSYYRCPRIEKRSIFFRYFQGMSDDIVIWGINPSRQFLR